jgi:selenium metabolism protein YedF
MIEIDCTGLTCPIPVVRTKSELSKLAVGEKLFVKVDNTSARDNIIRLARHTAGCSVNVKSQKKGTFTIEIVKGELLENKVSDKRASSGTVLFVTSDKVGRGSDELGTILMSSMFGAIQEVKPLPKTIVFMNSGVKLTVEGSPVLDKIKGLEKLGVGILICGTCLDYFHLKDKVGVGTVSNMFTILETLLGASNVVSP